MTPRWVVHDDLLRHLSLDDYEEAKRILEELCHRHGVARERVGYFGRVGHPGISDIDAVIVGDAPRLTRVVQEFEKRREESAWLRSMFWHEPLYVLDDVLEIVSRLHTLVGLSEPLREELHAHPATSAPPTAPSPDEVLHGIWMTFLVQVVAGLWRLKDVSARTLLLVHKNLEYSERYFSERRPGSEPQGSSAHLNSEAVRSLALEGRSVATLATDFSAQYEAARRAFAEYWRQAPGASQQSTGLSLLVYRRFVCIRGGQTTVRRFRGASVGVATPWPFDVTQRFARGHEGDDAVGQYVRTAIMARRAYERAGLAYPFVGPFGLRPPRGR